MVEILQWASEACYQCLLWESHGLVERDVDYERKQKYLLLACYHNVHRIKLWAMIMDKLDAESRPAD